MKVVNLPIKRGTRVLTTLARNDRVQRSPYGYVQREVLPGERWRTDITWTALHGDIYREVSRWLTEASRGDVYTAVPASRIEDSPSGFGELLSNPNFDRGLDYWSAVDAVARAGVRRVRVQNTAASAASLEQTVALTAGCSYVAMAYASAGDHALFRVQLYDLVAGANLVALSTTTEGLIVAVGTATSTGDHEFRLISRAGAAGNHVFYSGVSLSRCLLVDGASQTGGSLALKGMPVSTDRVMKAGDFFAVMTDATAGKVNPKVELKRLLEDLDSDSAGKGVAYFEPQLRNSPSDGAAVLVHRPFFYGYFPDPETSLEQGPPRRASLSLTLEEDVLAPS